MDKKVLRTRKIGGEAGQIALDPRWNWDRAIRHRGTASVDFERRVVLTG